MSSAVLDTTGILIGIPLCASASGKRRFPLPTFFSARQSFAASAPSSILSSELWCKPSAVLCGYVHLLMSVSLLFSATNYIRAITPVDPLEQLPGRFVSGFLTAQIFFLVYCVVGIFSPPPENEYVRLTGESP